MEKNLVDAFLSKTLEYLNSTEAFLQKNVPAYVEELLIFDFYSAVMWTLFFPLIALALCIVAKKLFKRAKANKESDKGYMHYDDPHYIFGVISSIVTGLFVLISLFTVPINLEDAIKIKVAPRVYLVEKISSQLGGNK